MDLRHALYLTAAAVLLCFIAAGLYNGLTVRRYTIRSDKLDGTVRIALVTDLHSCRYGKDQHKLIEAVDALRPDIVCMSGDIFDNKLPDGNTEKFLAAVSENYPCYYVTGNHEYWCDHDEYRAKMDIIEKYNIRRLSGDADTVTVNGQTISICGADDRASYLISHQYEEEFTSFIEQMDSASRILPSEYYTVLLSHRPEYFALYRDHGFDLALTGHAHGGQWRIPGILNGLVAPNQGLFPKYAGGLYEENGTTMIVSRGLARESTLVPRFYNPPEVVLVELAPETE